MKKTICLVSTILLSFHLFSCDIFCRFCHPFEEDDFIFGGEIILEGNEFIQIKILDQFRGIEQRDVITIWSGTDFECNGPWSMSANSFGNIGDTILVTTRLIETIENTWDIICDYRRSHYCFLSSATGAPDWVWAESNGTTMTYEIFRERWNNQDLEFCDNYESVKEGCTSQTSIELNILPNPTFGKLSIIISSILEKDYALNIFDASGKWILTQENLKTTNELELGPFPVGVYFVSILEKGKVIKTKRVIKN